MKSISTTIPQSGVRRPAADADAGPELQVPALERGLAILELLAQSPGGMTLAEINGVMMVPTASVFRIATALEQLGYLHRDPATKKFTLTRKPLLLGQPRGSGRGLVEASIESMRSVRTATGETAQLCCLIEEHCVVLEQLPSLHPFKYIVDLGSRPPVYCTAPGKAMLAFLPTADRDVLLNRLQLTRHTPRTITSRAVLESELAKVRSLGYAVDHGEHFEGIHCVAAPLLDGQQCTIGAITIAGPAERIPESRFHAIGNLMIEAANEAARRFLG